jgi:uroporphyrinogen-III synthase
MSTVSGRRVLITRAQDDAELWAAQLRERGAEPIVFPCIICSLEQGPEVASQLREALKDATWLVLSSRRAADAVAGLLALSDSPLPEAVQVAAVGPATAAAARKGLGRADLIAAGGTAAALCEELGPQLGPSDQVVAALTEAADDSTEAALSAAGAHVQRINVYRSAPTPPQDARTDLAALGVDVALLASPSAVTGLLNRAVLPDSIQLISIGPTTTAAAHAAGLRVFAEAQSRGLDAMLQTLETSP